MSLFSKETPPPEPTVTGVDVLRSVVLHRAHYPGSLAALAGMVEGTGIAALEDFAHNRGKPFSLEVLQRLAKVLYPGAELDPDTMLLRSSNREPPRPAPVHPGNFVPESSPHWMPTPPASAHLGLRLPAEDKPKPKGRPGWSGGF